MAGFSYDHLMGQPMDVLDHPDNNLSPMDSGSLEGGMTTLRRDMGTSAGNFISKLQSDSANKISGKFRHGK